MIQGTHLKKDGDIFRPCSHEISDGVFFKRVALEERYDAVEDKHLGAFVDVETTGLDPSSDEIIQATIHKFWFDDEGRIGKVEKPITWFNEPKRNQLRLEITELTGITPNLLIGQVLPPEEIAAHLNEVRCVFAHHARFDRKMIEAHCRGHLNQKIMWFCTLEDPPWDKYDYRTKKLDYLMFKMGLVYDAHTSEADTAAGIILLTRTLGDMNIMKHCFQVVGHKKLIRAENSPFEKKDILKKYGYRWDSNTRCWIKEVDVKIHEEEMNWLRTEIYRGSRHTPTSETITVWERFR